MIFSQVSRLFSDFRKNPNQIIKNPIQITLKTIETSKINKENFDRITTHNAKLRRKEDFVLKKEGPGKS